MLALPSTGFTRSTTKHNIDIEICCDWLEASALFVGSLSLADVVDTLRENHIYEDQGFAWELLALVNRSMQLRSRCFGDGYPIAPTAMRRVEARGSWREFSPYAFCLALSASRAYPKWADAFGNDYTEQARLFEELTTEAVQATFAGWNAHKTGWGRTATKALSTVVDDLVAKLGETKGNLARWTKASAKDAGLDVMFYFTFPDGRGALPAYLLQCASGAKWKPKLKTPDTNVWAKAIDFTVPPRRGIALPFALSETEFRHSALASGGLLLDRHRLLAPGLRARAWTSSKLRKELITWIKSRVASLPKASDDGKQIEDRADAFAVGRLEDHLKRRSLILRS